MASPKHLSSHLLVLFLLIVCCVLSVAADRPRPLSEKRDGNDIATMLTDPTGGTPAGDSFFFSHLHNGSRWQRVMTKDAQLERSRKKQALLSDVEAVRGALLCHKESGDTHMALTVATVNSTKGWTTMLVPYAHLLPFVTQKQYRAHDEVTPTSLSEPREAQLSASRRWPYYFCYDDFETSTVYTESLCGVAELDRGSFGVERFGVDEVLLLVYNDWSAHVEHALALAESAAQRYVHMHEMKQSQLTNAVKKNIRAALPRRARLPTLMVPDGNAFTAMLNSLAPGTTSATETNETATQECATTKGSMLWIPVDADGAKIQIVAAARQRQMASSEDKQHIFSGEYTSLFVTDIDRPTPYFAVLRRGVVRPTMLPVYADTTLTEVSRFVVQRSMSTFQLRSAEQIVQLVNHYGQLVLVLPTTGIATSPWNAEFPSAFTALRDDLPMFGLEQSEVDRLPWDRMQALPRTILSIPAESVLHPGLRIATLQEVRRRLALADEDKDEAGRNANDDTVKKTVRPLVCVRLIEAAVLHGPHVSVESSHERRWQWQDICTDPPLRYGNLALWDSILGAQLRDTVVQTAAAAHVSPPIRNGVAFARAMRQRLRSPMVHNTTHDHVLVVLDDAEGLCGDAARSIVYDSDGADGDSDAGSLVLHSPLIVVDGEAHALQEELFSAAQAAALRRATMPAAPRDVLSRYQAVLAGRSGHDACRILLATGGGELFLWPAPSRSKRNRLADRWAIESLPRPVLHRALETLETRLSAASHADASTVEIRSDTFRTTGHDTPWQVVLPAGQDHPVVVFDFSTSTGPTELEVVALVDRSCGLSGNVLKSLWLLRACQAHVGEVDLRDNWLQRRGASLSDAASAVVRDSRLSEFVRTHAATDWQTLRPPTWFVANTTHLLTSFPSAGYTEKNTWDVVVIEWLRLMGLNDTAADNLHRCAQTRIAEEIERRARFRSALGSAPIEVADDDDDVQVPKLKKNTRDDGDRDDDDL